MYTNQESKINMLALGTFKIETVSDWTIIKMQLIKVWKNKLSKKLSHKGFVILTISK